MMPFVPLATFLAVQLGAAIWWAARVSTQLDGVRDDLRDTSTRIVKLTEAVQTHETAIAVMEMVSKQQQQRENGRSGRA